MELRHLRYFVAAAEELHFRRAAERLGIGPARAQSADPAARAGDRSSIVSSPHSRSRADRRGHRFSRRCSRDPPKCRAGESQGPARRARRSGNDPHRIYRLCLVQPYSPSVIQDYRARFPGIAVSLVEAGTSQLVDSLRAGRVDAAFIRSPSREVDGLFVLSIMEEEMLIALPSRHDLAARHRYLSKPERRAVYPVSAGKQPRTLRQRPSGLPTRRLQHEIVQQAPEVSSALNLIAAGEGVSIVPASMQRMQPQGVAYRPILGNAPRGPLSLAHRNNEPSAAVRNLAALARRAAANIGRDTLAEAG